MEKKIRILIGVPGLDGHDRGAIVVANACRDAGMEIIYLGVQQIPEAIASAAVAEDVDVVGLSLNDGCHTYYFPEVMRQLREKGGGDILVVGGGNIPKEEKPILEKAGITGNFTYGTPLKEIVNHIIERVKKERLKEKS